jgi:hypothetical protein
VDGFSFNVLSDCSSQADAQKETGKKNFYEE